MKQSGPGSGTVACFLEGRQETKKAHEDKQTRLSITLGTQFTDVTVLANCPICSLYCCQLLGSVAVSVKNGYSLINILHLASDSFRSSRKIFPYLHIHRLSSVLCQ